MTQNERGSREAVLDAAEVLFAEQGHDGTSIEEIGRSAGLSRGSPGYLFGSKQGLYRAVLERATSQAESTLAPSYAAATEAGHSELSAIIEAYIDFQIEHPRLVRLLQWEALTGRLTGTLPGQVEAVDEARDFVETLVDGKGEGGDDAALLLLGIFALCSYPFAPHSAGVMAALGLDPKDEGFRLRYSDHVKRLAAALLETE